MSERPLVTAHVATKQAAYHAEVVGEVASAIAENDVVVVGMAVNPHVKRARQALDDAKVAYTYLGYGGYHSMWKERLAIKIWAGWPTFPQIYVKGRLIGGANETVHMLETGELADLLDAPRP
ncbi:MAG: glutaredoxin [Alphaproteobacteria bacterium]|nr:glutaredoxin [Myxococcales bacterium]MCB9675840.1 glutaredoxin [Alphaproteobacteria bacterium]